MRSQVAIVQIRCADIQSGDVVNRRGPERTGWIEVERLEALDEGTYVVHDEAGRDSFTAVGYDLCWLQTVTSLHSNSHIAVDLPA